MKRKAKMVAGIIAVLAFAALTAFAIYWHSNATWFQRNLAAIERVGAAEKQATLPSGRVINYGEVANDKPALMLIHGQMAAWEDYAPLLEELGQSWHVYAVDVYGHGQSTHDEEAYYLDENGDDLIWFIDNVIGSPTVVSGHSNGAITAAYIAAFGGDNVSGAVLEDPPIFSTAGENWESTFAYLDTYQPLHEYGLTDKSECWEAYYLRHCLWGKLFMGSAMNGIANYAQSYHDSHPGEPVRIGFLPPSSWLTFEYIENYDKAYGERFYNMTWNHGYTHEEVLSKIEVPCVYLHAKETLHESGVYLCAATGEQAERAVGLIGSNCTLVETDTSDHCIHSVHKDVYLDAVNFLR